MVGIHECHGKLAEVVLMCTNAKGDLVMGLPELRTIMPLLRENMELIYRLDALKELAFQAHLTNDVEWKHEICKQIDELEVKCL